MRRKIELILLVVLVIAVILNIWSSYERHKINREYRETVNRFKVAVEEYEQIAERINFRIDQVEGELN